MVSKWTGKSKGYKLGYQIIYYLMKFFGLSFAYFVLRFIALYYFFFSFKSSINQYYLFKERLKYSIFKSIISVYINYYQFAQTLTDRVYTLSGLPPKFTFTFDGEEHLKEILDLKKGMFLISAHLGNWEIAGALLSRLVNKVHVVMYESEHEGIKLFLDSVKSQTSFNLILIKPDDIEHIYHINEAILKNEIICIHGDRYINEEHIIESLFLGAKANFPMGAYITATQLEAPISFVFATKVSKFHYKLFASEPIITEKPKSRQEKNEYIHSLQKKYIKSLESILLQYPTQWFNYYQFWNL